MDTINYRDRSTQPKPLGTGIDIKISSKDVSELSKSFR